MPYKSKNKKLAFEDLPKKRQNEIYEQILAEVKILRAEREAQERAEARLINIKEVFFSDRWIKAVFADAPTVEKVDYTQDEFKEQKKELSFKALLIGN